MAECPGSAHQPLLLLGGCLIWAPFPCWQRGTRGGHATAVTEGTFPSHLELSKSRSQLAAWLQDPPWAPSPRTVATQTHGRGCVQQMWAWEAARNPTVIRARRT